MRLDMPIVETSRLILRAMEEEDVCDLFEVYQGDEICQYLSIKPHESIEDTLHFIRSTSLAYEKRGVPQTWAIVWKEKEKVIGDIAIHTLDEDIGEIGYVLHCAYWHQGIMQEALSQLVRIAFEHVGLRRLQAKYEIHNVQSAKLLEHCGFHQEGVLRAYTQLSDGNYHDMGIASILKSDWKELRK